MKLPKMIIFDYGFTLMGEPDFSSYRGAEAVCEYLTKNPRNLTVKEIDDFGEELFKKIHKRANGEVEYHQHPFQNLAYGLLGLEFSADNAELERTYWRSAAPGQPMPGIKHLLNELWERGIRTGVISNINFSGALLTEEINRAFPDNHFEFIVATSEYVVKKPDPLIFQIALVKAGLEGADCWYCGDTPSVDCDGAHGSGLFPVWFDDRTIKNPYNPNKPDFKPPYEWLHIHEWKELLTFLDRCEE